jgi:hypothetical protein
MHMNSAAGLLALIVLALVLVRIIGVGKKASQ